jgi:hypothetical protein
MRWVEHVARIADRRGAYRVLVGTPEGKRPLGNLGAEGRIILNLFSRSAMGRHGLY